MKARTSGSGRTGCEAVQYADQMQCARCGLAYDVNDQDPPECRKGDNKQKGRAYLEALRRSLQN